MYLPILMPSYPQLCTRTALMGSDIHTLMQNFQLASEYIGKIFQGYSYQYFSKSLVGLLFLIAFILDRLFYFYWAFCWRSVPVMIPLYSFLNLIM